MLTTFTEQARLSNSVILVHCVAGVSRSVTMTLAYLMYAQPLTLNEAFSLVRARKPDISPNFHFMQQLHTFELKLRDDPTRQAEAAQSSTPMSGGGGTASLSSAQAMRHIVAANAAAAGRRRTKYECSCLEFDCKCALADTPFGGPFTGVSPDSGIEFDRWSSDNTPK